MSDTTTLVHTGTVRTTFDAGHRLPQLRGKCVSLHGHTWEAFATFSVPTNIDPETGIITDFSEIKTVLNGFTASRFDHGVILGTTDPLANILTRHHTKVYRVGDTTDSQGLKWPTVEAVAEIILRGMKRLILQPNVVINSVTVNETPNNSVTVTALSTESVNT